MSDERINRLEERQDRQESMHHETIKALNDLVSEMRVQSSKFDTVINQQNKQEHIIERFRDELEAVKQTQAGFMPFIDMMKSIKFRK